MDALNRATVASEPSTSGGAKLVANTNQINGAENGDTNRPNENKMRRKARGCRGECPPADVAGNERQPRKPKLKMQKKNNEDLVARQFKIMQNDVNNGLRSCEPGKELEVLHRSLRPDHHLLWYKCIEVKKDLVNDLYRFYPMVRLEVFGSTVMGMAFKGQYFFFRKVY